MRLFWAITLVGLAARLIGLGTVYPVIDEHFQFYTSLAPAGLARFLEVIRLNPHHLLLDPLSTFFVGRWTGELFWLRFPSFIWSTLSIPLLLILARRSERSSLAPAAGLMLAFNLFHIDFSHRADFYALAVLCSLLHQLSFWRLLEDRRRWPEHAASTALFLYSHPYASVSLLLQAVYCAALERKALVRLAAPSALAYGAFLPWFWFSARGVFTLDFAFGEISGPRLAPFIARIPLFLSVGTEWEPLSRWSDPVQAAASAVFLAGYLASLRRAFARQADALVRYSHLLMIGGTLIVLAVNAWFDYFLAHRQLLWLLPSWLLCAADGWIDILERVRSPAARRLAGAALAAAVLSVSAATWRSVVTAQAGVRSGLIRLSDEVKRRARPDDCFSFESGNLAAMFLFEFDRAAFAALEPSGHFTLFRIPQGLRAGPGRNAVGGRESAGRCWSFRGSVEDLYVHPPEGRYLE